MATSLRCRLEYVIYIIEKEYYKVTDRLMGIRDCMILYEHLLLWMHQIQLV